MLRREHRREVPANTQVIFGQPLRLLTIDYDPAPPSPEYASITIPRAADKVVIDIIRQVAHSVSDSDANRLAQFAQGFPQIAVLIARAWPFDTSPLNVLSCTYFPRF